MFALTVPVLPLVGFSGAWIWMRLVAPMPGAPTIGALRRPSHSARDFEEPATPSRFERWFLRER
jgi:hypothetical protein